MSKSIGSSSRSVTSCCESRASASCSTEQLAQALLLHLAEVRVDAVDGSELAASSSAAVFGPTDGTPGMLSERVPHEREQIAHLRRQDAELLFDLGRAVGLVAHRVPHARRASPSELHQILVRADDDHEEPGVPRRAWPRWRSDRRPPPHRTERSESGTPRRSAATAASGWPRSGGRAARVAL